MIYNDYAAETFDRSQQKSDELTYHIIQSYDSYDEHADIRHR